GPHGRRRDRHRRDRRGRGRDDDGARECRLRPPGAGDGGEVALPPGDAQRRAGEVSQSDSARSQGDPKRLIHEEDVVTIQTLLRSALLILIAAGPAAAQSGSGVAAIEGTVTDPDNRAIPGALVL